jgi:hypothetical protein
MGLLVAGCTRFVDFICGWVMRALMIGRGCRKYEPLLISYLTLVSREKFLRYFFARVFLMDKTLREIRYQIDHYDEVKPMILMCLNLISDLFPAQFCRILAVFRIYAKWWQKFPGI